MFNAPKYFEKHQRMFKKMTPEELCTYCHQHPLYSLPAGVRNQREQAAVSTMEDCAKFLSQRDRQLLGIYVQETFARGCADVAPTMLNAFYAPFLANKDCKKTHLQKAIDEFLGFAKAPMTSERHQLLKQFVTHMSTRPATSFEKGMDAYRQATCLVPSSNLIILNK